MITFVNFFFALGKNCLKTKSLVLKKLLNMTLLKLIIGKHESNDLWKKWKLILFKLNEILRSTLLVRYIKQNY